MEADVARLVAILVRAEELSATSKPGQFDRHLMLDLVRQLWMVPLLRDLRGPGQPGSRLRGFMQAQLVAGKHAAALRAQLDGLGPCLYSLRHPGVSHDCSMNTRPRGQPQAKGQWDTFTSGKRYNKAGGLTIELLKMTVQSWRVKYTLDDLFEALFKRHWATSFSRGCKAGRKNAYSSPSARSRGRPWAWTDGSRPLDAAC